MLRPRSRGIRIRWFAGLAALILAGCRGDVRPTDGPPPTFSGQYPIRVVCTTGPVTDMLKALGGEHLEVTGLMGPGVDPHLYRALPADLRQLRAADMVFYNGLHLEGRMTDVLKELGRQKRTVAVTQALEESQDSRLRKPPEFEGYYDPHVWHDPNIWADGVVYVVGVLCEYDPQHSDDYQENGKAYLEQLEEADAYCRDQLATIPPDQRALVTAHDAFNYFCHAYGLTPMPLKGISTEDEVSIGRMEEVVEFLVDHKIKAVFVESAVAPRIVENLIPACRARGHEVRVGRNEGELYTLYADALGPPESGADSYLGMIRANVDTIVSALK